MSTLPHQCRRKKQTMGRTLELESMRPSAGGYPDVPANPFQRRTSRSGACGGAVMVLSYRRPGLLARLARALFCALLLLPAAAGQAQNGQNRAASNAPAGDAE